MACQRDFALVTELHLLAIVVPERHVVLDRHEDGIRVGVVGLGLPVCEAVGELGGPVARQLIAVAE